MAAAAALVLAVNVNWLASYPFGTFANSPRLSFLSRLRGRSWDVTAERRNSLSPETQRVLDGLQGRAQIYSFFPSDKDYRDVPLADEIRRLLTRLADYNGLVLAAFADARNEPDRARELARELALEEDGLEDMLVIDYQGRRIDVPAASLVSPPDWRAQMAGDSRWVFAGEKGLTQALMRLSDPRVPTVYFVHGHRELSLVEGSRPDRSIARFSRALARNNMRVRQYAFAANRDIPPECDILVVAAPREPYLERETAAIASYLGKGGRLLLLAPSADDDYPADDEDSLNRLVFAMGGSFRNDQVRDAVNNENDRPFYPRGRVTGSGESGVSLVFPLTRTIRDNPRSPENGWSREKMVESYPSAAAYPLAERDGVPRPGPFTFAYRAARDAEERDARVVVVASGRMASDSDIGYGANEALLVGMAQWLAGREESSLTSARPWVDRRLRLTGTETRAALWLALVAMPLIWVLAGMLTWWARKD